MILSSNNTPIDKEFEKLLADAQLFLEKKNKSAPDYFSKRTPPEFEKDVHAAMCEASKNTPFEDTIQLVSGHSFPDIISNNNYGVEVKKSKDNWKSTGNSVLESTRIDGIERIYLFFGRLTIPAEFRFRKYEECLHEVAVTHSPRYLIDMELEEGKSIFDKMKTSYHELRKKEKPIKLFVNYYREEAKAGQEPWWMEGAGEEDEGLLEPNMSLWNSLEEDDKQTIIADAMAWFPKIFGINPQKYQDLALWLASRKGVIYPNVRDSFSSGGQETIEIAGVTYENIPKIFYILNNNISKVIRAVKRLDPDEAKHFWKVEDVDAETILSKWLDLVISFSEESLPGDEKVIVHMLGAFVGESGSSEYLKGKMKEYNLQYSS